jgi:hypothetical protein
MSVEQGVRGIQHFTDQVFSKDSVGNLIIIALRSLQIESGSGSHLLENPSVWIPYITSCWLTSIQDFIGESKIKIKVTSARLVPTSHEQDRYIMDKIQQLGTYNNCQLFDINAVQMHLRVTTLSDVVDAQGKHITEEIFKGARPTDRHSQLKWPRQPVTTTKWTQQKFSHHRQYSDDVNIVTVIVDQMKESTLRFCLRWVKAGQDADKSYKELD